MAVYSLSKALPGSLPQGMFVIVCGKTRKENVTTGSDLEKHRLAPPDKLSKNV